MMEEESDNDTTKFVEVSASLLSYDRAEVLNGQLIFSAACASFSCKGEDRHSVCYDCPLLVHCQEEVFADSPHILVGYAGVFDGHDGKSASEYCADGLLNHIVAETVELDHRYTDSRKPIMAVDGTESFSPLDVGTINAFHRAQARFAAGMSPPKFDDVKKGAKATRWIRSPFERFRASPVPPPRGGTTAVTLAFYGEKVNPQDQKNYKPMNYAIVANTGDSRLITDHGTGANTFWPVTTDHRPDIPSETRRLRDCVKRGEARVGYDERERVLRVFPGGLAVSRTVGDMRMSKACVCTPDIFRVPITLEGKTQTTRFVLGSDGLFDILSNDKIGEVAARIKKTNDHEEIVDPEHAAAQVMERCLQQGGCLDDVTVIVFDVTYVGDKYM